MTAGWSPVTLIDALARRDRHPAAIVSGAAGLTVCECGSLAADARALAGGLHALGLRDDSAVAIWAPNSPEWITVALAVLASGSVLVPIDDLGDAAQFSAALQASGARLVFTNSRHLEEVRQGTSDGALLVYLLEAAGTEDTPHWHSLLRPSADPPAVPAHHRPAALILTSGTTGAPKAFHLSHGNIAANVEALREMKLVGSDDRALLPLPLHHAYPLIVGMLITLTLGTAIVLPADASGPAILKALRDGAATTIIGVPRLYDAILATLGTRLAARAWPLRLALRGAISTTIAVQRATGLHLGRAIFSPIRHNIAPTLRLLVSGGARLEAATADRLEALGWMVLSGYGLAETASLFTGNRPGARRRGSAGLPLAGGEIRIVNPDDQGIGEIELRGPSVTSGYLDNPEANRTGFTPDRWFRTGDLGYVDRDGFLFVTGRSKEILVLGGGKKVNPEDLERVYGAVPQIREIAVLEERGALVALVRPDPIKLREIGSTNLRDGVRVVLAQAGQQLASYERLSGFALTDQPLPRTRLGKYRRFLLPVLYAARIGGRAPPVTGALSEADVALLADPVAGAVWRFLQERYQAGAGSLDVNFALDLNLDSFAWMELAIALQDRLGLHLSEGDIASIETIRDLLNRCVVVAAARPQADEPQEAAISEELDRWLAPTGLFLTALGVFLYVMNFLVMRCLFRLQVSGFEHLPREGPFVIAPNHVSDLDAMAIAAALPLSRLRHVYWAGDIVRLFYNPAARLLCRAMHLFPVDETHPGAAVRSAARVLESGDTQVWFPEGWRSPDGKLQHFQSGIGQLLLRRGAQAVPAWIGGTFEALPRGKRIPRLRQVTVYFGPPATPETLRDEGTGRTDEERITHALRIRVVQLSRSSGQIVEEAGG